MQRWQLITAVALALLLVAGLALLLVLTSRQPAEPEAPVQPLSTIKMSQVERLTLRGADARETRLERDPLNDWYVVAPITAKADQDLVTWLLADLLDITSSNPAPAAEIDLAYAGLLTPTAYIVLGLDGGEEVTIAVGLTEPRYMAYFVRIGDSVYLFPWDIVDRAVRWLDVMPVPAAPTPASTAGQRPAHG